MRGGPGWDLARGRPDGVQFIGVAVGINVCEESNSSGVGTIQARITLSPKCQTPESVRTYVHPGMVHPGRARHDMQFEVLPPHYTHP